MAGGFRRVLKRLAPARTSVSTVAARAEARMNRLVLEALRDMQGRMNLSRVAQLLRDATPDEVYEAASAGGAEALVVQIQAEQTRAAREGGDAAGRAVAGPNVTLDLGRPGVAGWLKDHAAERVKQLSDEQREAVRAVIEDGVMRGRHPYRMAKDIRDVLPLDPKRARLVQSYREALESTGRPAAEVDKLVARFARTKLEQRAEVIARTESLTAVNRGRVELWGQLKESGDLPADVEQQWLTGEDERVCPWCGPLHLMRQPLGRGWSSSAGGKTLTCDAPPLHPNCRCTVALIERGEEEAL